jgi:hypothetical protein
MMLEGRPRCGRACEPQGAVVAFYCSREQGHSGECGWGEPYKGPAGGEAPPGRAEEWRILEDERDGYLLVDRDGHERAVIWCRSDAEHVLSALNQRDGEAAAEAHGYARGQEDAHRELDKAGIGRCDNLSLRIEELACQRDAAYARGRAEIEQAYGYLSRLFLRCAPQCEALSDLLGVCTQIDNYIVGLKRECDSVRVSLGGHTNE